MANPPPVQPETPRPWYAGLIGFVFAALVLTAAGVATAVSYEGDDDHGDPKSEEHGDEHSDDGDEHSDDGDEHSDDGDEHSDDEE